MVFFIWGLGLGSIDWIFVVGVGKVFGCWWLVSEIVVGEFVYDEFSMVSEGVEFFFGCELRVGFYGWVDGFKCDDDFEFGLI